MVPSRNVRYSGWWVCLGCMMTGIPTNAPCDGWLTVTMANAIIATATLNITELLRMHGVVNDQQWACPHAQQWCSLSLQVTVDDQPWSIPSNSVMVSILSTSDCTGHAHCQSLIMVSICSKSVMVSIPSTNDCTGCAHYQSLIMVGILSTSDCTGNSYHWSWYTSHHT